LEKSEKRIIPVRTTPPRNKLMGEFKNVKFDYDEKEQIMSILKAGDSVETKK
jgi:hypothetical protein